MPCDQPYLRAQATQRPTYPVEKDAFLPFEVEQALAKLLGRELKLAKDSENLKQELESRYDYNGDVLYGTIDDINYGFIDANNLKRYLIKNGTAAKEPLLLAIIRRYDLDADAKLKKAEFVEGIKALNDFSKRAVKEKTGGGTLSSMHQT